MLRKKCTMTWNSKLSGEFMYKKVFGLVEESIGMLPTG